MYDIEEEVYFDFRLWYGKACDQIVFKRIKGRGNAMKMGYCLDAYLP